MTHSCTQPSFYKKTNERALLVDLLEIKGLIILSFEMRLLLLDL